MRNNSKRINKRQNVSIRTIRSQFSHWGALVLPLLCCDVGDEVKGGGATVGVGGQSKG